MKPNFCPNCGSDFQFDTECKQINLSVMDGNANLCENCEKVFIVLDELEILHKCTT